ncbi:MAG: M28 family peptidase, partial [Promethearchaeota archaeon]
MVFLNMIDEKRLLENLKEFSFPRLSGTEFEKRSFNLAKNKLEELDLIPTIQEFSFSTFYSRLYPKISIILFNWLLIILFLNLDLIFNIVNLVLFFILIIVLISLTRNPERLRLGRKFYSQNLFVNLSSQSKDKTSEKNIFLFSHLDSKGQAFSIKTRIQLYFIWIISFLLALIIIILNSFFLLKVFLSLTIIAFFILAINCIATVLILVNATNNKSNGAIDNASGITCVLELLNYYSNPNNRPYNYDLWFVFTGAEESGTMGIRNFYRYIRYFDREKTFIINFDSIAQSISLWDHGLLNNKNFKSFNYILENKEIMKLEKTHRIYIGTYSDG